MSLKGFPSPSVGGFGIGSYVPNIQDQGLAPSGIPCSKDGIVKHTQNFDGFTIPRSPARVCDELGEFISRRLWRDKPSLRNDDIIERSPATPKAC